MMKKLFAFILLMSLMLLLTGCKKPNFSVRINEDMNVEIIAVKASKDMFGAAAGFEIAEGQKLYVEPSLKKGEISIKINNADLGIDATPKEITDALTGDAVLEIKISGTTPAEYELEPGTYGVSAAVLSKADGKILLIIR